MQNTRPLVFTLLITAVTYVAINGSRLAFPLYALHLEAPPFAIGIVGALTWIFPLLISWPVGVLADRYGARWILFGGSLCGMLGMMLPGSTHSLWALFAGAALAGFWNAIFHVLTLSLVGMLSPPSERALSFLRYSMLGSICNFSGPVVVGFAVEYAGHSAAFQYLAVSPVIVAILLIGLGHWLPGGQPRVQSSLDLRAILTDHKLLTLLSIGGCIQLGIDFFPFLLPIHAQHVGIAPSVVGGIMGAIYVASFVMQTLIPRILAQVGEIRIMVAIFLATAGCFSLVPVTENALALGILACCFGLSTGGGQAITTNMLFTHYGRSSPAETLGLRLTFNNAIRVVTPAIMGGLISGIGIAATCGVAVTILLWGSRITYRALHMRAT